MTRFLTLLAVAAVAGVMYVAAAPSGLRAKGPTARQFKALSARVKKLQTEIGQVKKLAIADTVVLADCLLYTNAPISQYGAVTAGATGYVYGIPTNTSTFTSTTALDLTKTGDTPLFYALGVNPSCASSIHPSTKAAAHLQSALRQILARN